MWNVAFRRPIAQDQQLSRGCIVCYNGGGLEDAAGTAD